MSQEQNTAVEKWEPTRLMPRHHLIIDLALTGMTNVEIARAAGVTAVTVAAVVNCPLGQSEIARRRSAIESQANQGLANQTVLAKKVLDDSALAAASTMRTLLDSPDESIKFRSAKDILDRAAGMGQSGSTVVVVNADRLQNLVIAMQEAKSAKALSSDSPGSISIPSEVVG